MLLDQVVSLEVQSGKIDEIVTIAGAGVALLEWPKPIDTAKHRAARRAVLKALQTMHGHGHAEKVRARKALQAAAKEAGILAVNRG